MLLLAIKVERSKYRVSEDATEEQEPGRRICLYQVPGTLFWQHPSARYQKQTCSPMSASWKEPWNEHTLQHRLYSNHVEDQRKGKKIDVKVRKASSFNYIPVNLHGQTLPGASCS